MKKVFLIYTHMLTSDLEFGQLTQVKETYHF